MSNGCLIDGQRTGNDSDTGLSAPSTCLTQLEGKSSARLKHGDCRWGEGLDAPAAGERAFFPHGYTMQFDVAEAIAQFGPLP